MTAAALSHRLFLLKELVKRDFQSRYAGSLLGWLWTMAQPLWQLLLFTFVFSTVLKIPLVGARTENFAAYLFCGLLVWMAMHEGILRSATAITDNAELMKKTSFPAEVLLLSVVLGALIQSIIATAVFVVVLAATGELGWQGMPLLVLAWLLVVGLSLGIGLILCCLHTIFRDTAQILSMVMTGWFYITPIVYPVQLVDPPYSEWIEWNPLTTLVSIYRQALLGDGLAWVPGTGRVLVLAALLLTVGLWLFNRLRPAFADEI